MIDEESCISEAPVVNPPTPQETASTADPGLPGTARPSCSGAQPKGRILKAVSVGKKMPASAQNEQKAARLRERRLEKKRKMDELLKQLNTD